MYTRRAFFNLSAIFTIAAVVAVFSITADPADGHEPAQFEFGEVIYENTLSSPDDIAGWVTECSLKDQPKISFHDGKMRMQSDAHFLLWCPEDFPDNIAVSWEFQPRIDNGLAMFWIAATGKEGKDLFDSALKKRTGNYSDYRAGDINALHLAYFRRNHPHERRPFHEINMQTVSLRKSTLEDNGPRMAEAADPIPSAQYAIKPYRMQVIKHGPYFRCTINGLTVLDWKDDGKGAPILEGGKIGFRQMKDLEAEYSNLRVRKVRLKDN